MFINQILICLGWGPKVDLGMDSSAARGAAQRLGAGKMRTLELKTLWLQDAVDKGELSISTVPGDRNVADIGTKVFALPRLKMLAMFGRISQS